jgi:hypothetical protein
MCVLGICVLLISEYGIAHANRSGNKRSSQPYALIDKVNQIDMFLFDPLYVKNITEMETKSLKSAALSTAPWTDSFWPMSKGLIARRWADHSFPESKTWLDNYNYSISTPPLVPDPLGTLNINVLSPAEKYDLLVGDDSFTLTKAMWEAGRSYLESEGNVPVWMGLCHGWAPASFMSANPKHTVTVPSAHGVPITFYPSDIKALSSLAWAEAPPRVKFVGSRCKVANPPEDAVGRVIDEKCFDVNPATWHMGVVNQLGVLGRSFVFDATYDEQVWNYPLYSYQYHYFNPQTLDELETIEGATVKKSDYSIDKFKKYRSTDSVLVIGIAMDISYVVPTRPSQKPAPSSMFHNVRYVYDLELDASGNIIGGEWYSNFHPDFMWNIPADGRPISIGEKRLGIPLTSAPISDWDGKSPLPFFLRDAAHVSSSMKQPLSIVVETLVRLSQESNN